ncbi:MAG TPA: helix-turn-helix domain-containing protein [Phycisphaerae bacterium]|nr:helix-turn-helix domain-containing protein [Phycisphaerae bacterium]
MPTFIAVVNDQIRRLARREINALTRKTRRLTAQHRRDIAALKRQLASAMKTVAFLEKQEKKRVGIAPEVSKIAGARFRADGLRTHRKKLGLSAGDYGKLIGVSGPTIYLWESGKTWPRKAQLAKYLVVRGIRKFEAKKRLELLGKR